MKKKYPQKRIFSTMTTWILALGFLVGNLSASPQVFAETPSPDIGALSDQIQKSYIGLQDLSMKFQQKTFVAILEKEVQKSGEIKLKKGGKFLVLYQAPEGRQYYSNGKKLWVYRPGDSQVQTTALNDETIPTEALSFLGGLGDLKRDFAVEDVDPKKWEAFKRPKGNLQWLELTPLKKLSQIAWLVMGFNPQTGIAEEVYLFTDSRNLTHYVFSDLKANGNLADSVFEFSQKAVKEVPMTE